MEIEIKDTTKTHNIGGADFVVDYGDPRVLDAHDDLLKYLRGIDAKNITSTEMNDKINECLKVAFGDEQYQKLVDMKATNNVNAITLATMIMKDVKDINTENSVADILKEFGLE